MSKELNKWRDIQSDEDSKDHVVSRPSFFNRSRHLDPLCDRLASSLFLDIPLCSKQGCNILRNMIALYEESVQVAYRPSSRPENGCCPVAIYSQKIDQFVSLFLSFSLCRRAKNDCNLYVG
jgi:hypothetical protein